MTVPRNPIDPFENTDLEELSALQAIARGTAAATGEHFFRELVRHLSEATGVPNALVAEFADSNTRVRALALWMDGAFVEDEEWDLEGTPCEVVLAEGLCHYPERVEALFPNEPGVESYLGVPLRDPSGEVLGHLAVFDTKPMPAQPRMVMTFEIFAARAAAELARLRVLSQLRESEERFRDLFDEAPIAYVHEGLESRFISANQAAQRILGITPEDVPGLLGRSLIPDTPDAQQRVQDALASVGRGTDASGVVLELRRKDDGRPVWIQWWSKPDPKGAFTRTMFLDITERVLMEQEQARLKLQNEYLREEIQADRNFDEIVGQSTALRVLLGHLGRVAETDATVLIQGESGTGKELIARAVHSASRRADKPLIKVNCAALPANLVESELFGHEKGAFTGAIAKRIGRFELADGGTLFLDEIGEIPLDVQVKLLRVLQEREFERVGGTRPIKVDVRVIAATNRNLLEAVADKTFRDDLYYRLNVFPVRTPPLRERPEDVPALTAHMIAKFAGRIGRKIDSVSPASLARLQAYRWPGNIRELENVIERAVILADGPILEIDPDMLPGTAEAADARLDAKTPGLGSLEAVEREHIAAVLAETRGVIEGANGAAKILGLNPSTLRFRMKKLGVAAGNRRVPSGED